MLFFYKEKKTETVVPLPFGGEMIENVLTASSRLTQSKAANTINAKSGPVRIDSFWSDPDPTLQ